MTTDPVPLRIGADRVQSGATLEVRSPYDDRLLAVVAKAGTDHLDAAVATAKATLDEGALPTHRRAEILDEAAARLRDDRERFARIVSDEAAKPIRTARVEVARAIDTLRFSAAVARTAVGEVIPLDASASGEGKVGFVLRVPIGVVAAITPFNFPLNLVCHKVGPALAAGCPVVLKPATTTPLSSMALAELFEDSGLPPGWLNVVPCPGSVADHLVTHDDVAMITFTGSVEVGWSIRSRAPRKRVGLELGNNAPVIIEPDGDWAGAAAKIKVAGYSHAGQSCISTQRVYVHRSVAAGFVDALVREVTALRIGDPADDATDVSALIAPSETERVKSWIDDAVAEGATLACGGEIQGRLLTPTVLTGVAPTMKVCAAEVFGPVVTVQEYDTFDEALALADDTTFGLQAAVFTSDIAKALRAARELHFGGVVVNEVPTWRADQMPYGGVRDSGNTREGPAYTVREMTEERLVVFQS